MITITIKIEEKTIEDLGVVNVSMWVGEMFVTDFERLFKEKYIEALDGIDKVELPQESEE